MNLHNLKPAKNATKQSKRIGRGQGSGKGGTATKGHKGAQSRSGYKRKIGFEGGQMPIYRLVPKRGFKNINSVVYSAINLSTLQALADKTKTNEITVELMRNNGLISKKDLVKVLANGELTSPLTVVAHAFSKTATEAIQKIGGKVVILNTTIKEIETTDNNQENKVEDKEIETTDNNQENKVEDKEIETTDNNQENKVEDKEIETTDNNQENTEENKGEVVE